MSIKNLRSLLLNGEHRATPIEEIPPSDTPQFVQDRLRQFEKKEAKRAAREAAQEASQK